MQARLAQAAARDAEAEWKRHAGHCSRCSRVGRDRTTIPCGDGAELRNELVRLRAVARKEAEADRAPDPAQGSLF